jgi:hypothetical protein
MESLVFKEEKNNTRNLKNFQKLKKYHNKNKKDKGEDLKSELINNILEFLSPRERNLFVIDINKYFYETILKNELNCFIKNENEINRNFINCLKLLKDDFAKIEHYKCLLFNYGLNQTHLLQKFEGKFISFILYRSVYVLSFYLFKDVQQIDLQKQNMGPDSLILLNNLIKKTNALIGLNLAYNNLGDDGCKILKNCLEENKSLQSLNLECNSIGDLGLNYLSNPIINHKTLKTMKLALNIITIVGMDNLVLSLKNLNTNSQINVIDFKYNNYKIESDEKYKDYKFLKISYN